MKINVELCEIKRVKFLDLINKLKSKLNSFYFTQLKIGDEEIMTTSSIGAISELKWTIASTIVDFNKWFKIFECALVINRVPMNTDEGKAQAQAKAMLFAFGGDKIRASLEKLATYDNATCEQAVTHLKTT
jgi:hypothetical protein